MGGRTVTFDDSINIRKRIMKIIKVGKLSKKTDLTAFYASDKDKIIIENKLKKIKEGIQFLAIMDQLATKKRKIITASINPRSKNQILRLIDRTKFIDLIFYDDQIFSSVDILDLSAFISRRTANMTLNKSNKILIKFFDTINTDPISDDKFKIKFFPYNISVPVNKIIDDLYLHRIINDIIDSQIDMIQYFIS
jgi:hypothetical protein